MHTHADTHAHFVAGSPGNTLASEGAPLPIPPPSSGPAQSPSKRWGFKRAAAKAAGTLCPLAVRVICDQDAFIEFRLLMGKRL